jgi:hypothetical protein
VDVGVEAVGKDSHWQNSLERPLVAKEEVWLARVIHVLNQDLFLQGPAMVFEMQALELLSVLDLETYLDREAVLQSSDKLIPEATFQLALDQLVRIHVRQGGAAFQAVEALQGLLQELHPEGTV